MARQRGLEGMFAGLVIGLFIVCFTGFRLDLSSKNKKPQSIVRQRLKKELEQSNLKKELEPEVEEYTFSSSGLAKKNLSKSKEAIKPRQKKDIKKLSKITTETKKRTKSTLQIKPRLIYLNTFTNKDLKEKSKKEQEKEIVPDNLPIFTEDKYNKEEEENNISEKRTEKQIKEKEETENVFENKRRKNKKEDTPDIPKNNISEREKIFSNVEPHEIRKPNAHNIANGFTPPIAPDAPADDEDLTAEEIKDRLNRLLRGDL